MDKSVQLECKYKKIGYAKFEEFIEEIGGKWKLRILYCIATEPTQKMRYGEFKKAIQPISHKVLANQLKELEHDGFIIRKKYNQNPPKVEYYMSDKGKSLDSIFNEIMEWIINQEEKGIIMMT